jgi:hypothetical protein
MASSLNAASASMNRKMPQDGQEYSCKATLPANTGSIFIVRSPIVSWQSGQFVLIVIATLLTRPDFCRDAFTSNLARSDRPAGNT